MADLRISHNDWFPAIPLELVPRIGLLCLLFLGTALMAHRISHGHAVPLERELATFPRIIGPWTAGPDQRLPANVVRVLGVDDYLSRWYRGRDGTVSFFLSYFESTWGGKAYHSPRNCMPGSGWDVVNLEIVPIMPKKPWHGRVEVSQMVMQKGVVRQVVLYWYQGRGRIMPTEIIERFYRVVDSIFRHRTDGAFVRIIVPVEDKNVQKAMQLARSFAEDVFPFIDEYVPK